MFAPQDPRLTAYALGELEDPDVRAVESHLAECEESRRFVEEIRETARLLQQELANESCPGLTARQHEQIEAHLSRRHRARRWKFTAISLSVAASVALVAVGIIAIPRRQAGMADRRGDEQARFWKELSDEVASDPAPAEPAPTATESAPASGGVGGAGGYGGAADRYAFDRMRVPSAAPTAPPAPKSSQPMPGLQQLAEPLGVVPEKPDGAVDFGVAAGRWHRITQTQRPAPAGPIRGVQLEALRENEERGRPSKQGEESVTQRRRMITTSAASGTTPAESVEAKLGQATKESLVPASPAAIPEAEVRLQFSKLGRGLERQMESKERFKREAGGVAEAEQLFRGQLGDARMAPAIEAGYRQVNDAPVSTFPLELNSRSYSLVQQQLRNNELPSREVVRVDEMVNYFYYSLPAWENSPVNVEVELADSPWLDGEQLARIGVQSRVVTSEANVMVKFNPNVVAAYRLHGLEQAPTNLSLSAGATLAAVVPEAKPANQNSITALYSIQPQRSAELAKRVDVAVKNLPAQTVPARSESANAPFSVMLGYKLADGKENQVVVHAPSESRPLSAASPDFRFAAAVCEFGLLLRDSPYKGTATFDDVLRLAQQGQKPGDPDRAEFLDLVRKAKELAKE